MVATRVTLVVLATACRSPQPSIRYELQTQAATGAWVTMVDVTRDDRVHQLPGMAEPAPHELHLRGDRIVDELGHDQVACRGDHVFVDGKSVAHLGTGSFDYATTTVTVSGDQLTIRRPGDPPAAMRLIGDASLCTIALLFFAMPVPSASG